MVLEIASALLARIQAEAEGSPGMEVCGLLLGDSPLVSAAEIAGYGAWDFGALDELGATVGAVLPCRNVAADPAQRFEIDPSTLIAAHRAARTRGPAILGYYHSHPGGSPEPSSRDAADAAPDGRVWLILGSGQMRAWRAVPGGAIHGRFDPLALHVAP